MKYKMWQNVTNPEGSQKRELVEIMILKLTFLHGYPPNPRPAMTACQITPVSFFFT